MRTCKPACNSGSKMLGATLLAAIMVAFRVVTKGWVAVEAEIKLAFGVVTKGCVAVEVAPLPLPLPLPATISDSYKARAAICVPSDLRWQEWSRTRSELRPWPIGTAGNTC